MAGRGLHAWFSEAHAKENGYAVYLNADGEEVKVTEVREVQTPCSNWPDMTYVGRVKSFVRREPDVRVSLVGARRGVRR